VKTSVQVLAPPAQQRRSWDWR